MLLGLEVLRGVLYEIGVVDDGMFVGFIKDEFDESFNIFCIMVVSLGCNMEVFCKVVVGDCEWIDLFDFEEGLCLGLKG